MQFGREFNDNLGAFNLTREGEEVQMTSQDFGPLRSSANTSALMSYDIDLELQTCSCR